LKTSILFVAEKPNWDLGRLNVEVSISQRIRETRCLGLLWTSNQIVAEAATYTTHNKHKRRISITVMEFEPAIAVINRPQTYALERSAHRSANSTPYN